MIVCGVLCCMFSTALIHWGSHRERRFGDKDSVAAVTIPVGMSLGVIAVTFFISGILSQISQ